MYIIKFGFGNYEFRFCHEMCNFLIAVTVVVWVGYLIDESDIIVFLGWKMALYHVNDTAAEEPFGLVFFFRDIENDCRPPYIGSLPHQPIQNGVWDRTMIVLQKFSSFCCIDVLVLVLCIDTHLFLAVRADVIGSVVLHESAHFPWGNLSLFSPILYLLGPLHEASAAYVAPRVETPSIVGPPVPHFVNNWGINVNFFRIWK